jgi:hypothetical protein
VDINALALAGIVVVYTLLLLVVLKRNIQRQQAVCLSMQAAEINFALKEGHTIIGVSDTTTAMRFYIGDAVRDESSQD